MAFTPASFSTHAQYLPKNLSLLLEPGFLNYPHVKLPAPRLSTSFNLQASSHYADLPKNWLIEPCRDATALQFSPLNSKKPPPSPSLHHIRPLPHRPMHSAGMGQERENGNVFNFKNWQVSSEWFKYLGSVKFPPLQMSTNDRSKGSIPVCDWPEAVQSQSRTPTKIKEDICPFSRSVGNAGLETCTTATSSFNDTQTNDLKSCTSKAKDKQMIRHSIREILEPREKSPLPYDAQRLKRPSQTLNDEASKRTQRSHGSWLNRKLYFSSDGFKSERNSKEVRLKLRQKVSSVLAKSSSAHTEMHDSSFSKSSRKSKVRSAFDSLGDDNSTFSAAASSISDFLESGPMSPHASMTRIQSERKTFQCPQCRYVTDRKNNLKRHIVTMHQDSGKVLECCGVPFQSKAALRDHNTVFHRGGYRCQICARNFCRKALLRRHLTVHSGQKDYFCELCGYATSHKSNLERHQKVHVKKSDDFRSLCSRQQTFPSKSNLTWSQTTENKSKRVASSFLDDVARTTFNINDESIDKNNINAQEYLSNFGHVNDAIESREFHSSTRHKGKRAGFFTSRLEETHDKRAGRNSSSISPTSSEPQEKIRLDSNTDERFHRDTSVTNHNQQNDDTGLSVPTQENESSNIKADGNDCKISVEEKETTEIGCEVQNEREVCPVNESVNEPSNPIDTNSASEEDSKLDVSLPYTPHSADETPETEKAGDVLKERHKIRGKRRICTVFYECDDCGQKLPSQQAVQSHSCSKVSADRIMGLSLVTALQKGCLKPQSQSSSPSEPICS